VKTVGINEGFFAGRSKGIANRNLVGNIELVVDG